MWIPWLLGKDLIWRETKSLILKNRIVTLPYAFYHILLHSKKHNYIITWCLITIEIIITVRTWDSATPLNPQNKHEDQRMIMSLCQEFVFHTIKLDTCIKNKATRSPEISREQVQKLTPQFLLYIYILDIDSHCPYLLSGETTFQLTSC